MPHFIKYKLNVAACRKRGVPQGFVLGPLSTTALSVTLFLTLFFSFVHFLKHFLLITHGQWYLCTLTEIKK